MKSIRAKDIFHLIFVVASLFLVAGCNPQPQVAATSTSTSPAASATPTRKVIPTRTPTPRAVLPVLRTPDPREVLPREGTVEFRIIHWNDFHGELVENDLTGVWIPGAARLAAFVKTEKEKYDAGQVLILDAGDWFEGTSVVAYSNVGKVWELYKQLGVNAATVGNHELFWACRVFIKWSVRLRRWRSFQ
jgi:2',3'-cyclic-nucleotide 2'-phosphodiesterase (5'-nucleotidase family)